MQTTYLFQDVQQIVNVIAASMSINQEIFVTDGQFIVQVKNHMQNTFKLKNI